jgi:5-methylcytosine-specific restriction endonuclease McrA
MRQPCAECSTPDGTIETVNGQDTVRCAWCKHFCYNAPKTETGRRVRPLTKRPNISTGMRKDIFLRDGGACIICHSTDRPEVGHLISVADGAKYGIDFDLIHSDENLAVMCATCNNGIGEETVPIRLICKAFLVRIARNQPGTGDQVHQLVSKKVSNA